MFFKHPHSNKSVTVKRTQLPILPGFAMTAHKAQGKTIPNCVVNLTGCRGTESPYVMLSRVTALSGLVILTPFPKSTICCHRSEDTRAEFRRLDYLALKTIIASGTETEVARASGLLSKSFGPKAQARELSAIQTEGQDAAMAVDKLQQSNAVLIGPYVRRGKISITAADASASTSVAAMHLPPGGHGVPLFPDAPNIAGPSRAVPKPSRTPPKQKLDDTSAPKSRAKRRKT
ncbi:hypothetical protein B0H13DRAFT_2398387 [Mycena leptocephala]|nr:hypothetical protein B0H13DRAFT_2398387 [Mycena leptocephala]